MAEDTNEDLELAWPGVRGIGQVVLRVVRLRCPYCGRGPVMQHWLRMRERCGYCHRLLQRGERDYFIGSMMFNLVLSEAVFVAVLVLSLWFVPPPTPWDALEFWIPVGMIAAPFVMFPFSRLAWLGFDLLLRPDRPSRGDGPAQG